MPSHSIEKITAMTDDSELTEKKLLELKKQRYDRQIRVWGADAQMRIQNARVLVCGLHGLHIEVVKNVVLAGMNIVIQDSSTVCMQDLSHNFFISAADVGRNNAEAALQNIQQLNTYTSVGIVTRALSELDAEFLKSFSVILVGDCDEKEALHINSICRQNVPQTVFFLSGTFGLEGWFVSDFGIDFQHKADPPNDKKILKISFPSLEEVFSQNWNSSISRFFPLSTTYVKSRILREFLTLEGRYPLSTPEDTNKLDQIAMEKLSANNVDEIFLAKLELNRFPSICSSVNAMTCSVLGSYLAQEVIKGVSMSGVPGFNVFEFSGNDCSVRAFPFGA